MVKEEFLVLVRTLVLFASILFATVIMLVWFVEEREKMVSSDPLTPDLKIEVKDGRADTTYIYKIKHKTNKS